MPTTPLVWTEIHRNAAIRLCDLCIKEIEKVARTKEYENWLKYSQDEEGYLLGASYDTANKTQLGKYYKTLTNVHTQYVKDLKAGKIKYTTTDPKGWTSRVKVSELDDRVLMGHYPDLGSLIYESIDYFIKRGDEKTALDALKRGALGGIWRQVSMLKIIANGKEERLEDGEGLWLKCDSEAMDRVVRGGPLFK